MDVPFAASTIHFLIFRGKKKFYFFPSRFRESKIEGFVLCSFSRKGIEFGFSCLFVWRESGNRKIFDPWTRLSEWSSAAVTRAVKEPSALSKLSLSIRHRLLNWEKEIRNSKHPCCLKYGINMIELSKSVCTRSDVRSNRHDRHIGCFYNIYYFSYKTLSKRSF